MVRLFKVVLDSSGGQKKTSDLQVLKAAKYGYHNEGLNSGHSCRIPLKTSSSDPSYSPTSDPSYPYLKRPLTL